MPLRPTPTAPTRGAATLRVAPPRRPYPTTSPHPRTPARGVPTTVGQARGEVGNWASGHGLESASISVGARVEEGWMGGPLWSPASPSIVDIVVVERHKQGWRAIPSPATGDHKGPPNPSRPPSPLRIPRPPHGVKIKAVSLPQTLP